MLHWIHNFLFLDWKLGSFIMSRKFGSDPIMLKSRCLGYFWADKTRKSEIFGFLGPSQAKMPFFDQNFEKFLKKSIILVKKWNFWNSRINHLKEQLLTVRMSYYWRIFILNFRSYGNFKMALKSSQNSKESYILDFFEFQWIFWF